ncbi:MAG TPA: hypothetical protein VE053_12180 [Allosphingosinicella sp.]|nr:hypothetical protein [Allosphingosinicella sp.]
MSTCSPERPWGIHPVLRSDEDCPRCGWTAPGPKGDAVADALEARALAAMLGWAGGEAAAHAA